MSSPILLSAADVIGAARQIVREDPTLLTEMAPANLAYSQPDLEPLPVALELVARLAKAKVRYGVYKNVNTVEAALAGYSDLDLLVAKEDAAALRKVLVELRAIRGVPSRFHDNSGAGREDWFVPDFSRADFLHIDLSTGMLIGRKYRKRYLALTYDEVSEWGIFNPAIPIPTVSSAEEGRIAVLRSIFRLPAWSGTWTPLGPTLGEQLIPLAEKEEAGRLSLTYCIGSEKVVCPVRSHGTGLEIESSSVSLLRKLLRNESSISAGANIQDLIVHQIRQFTYRAERTARPSNA